MRELVAVIVANQQFLIALAVEGMARQSEQLAEILRRLPRSKHAGALAAPPRIAAGSKGRNLAGGITLLVGHY